MQRGIRCGRHAVFRTQFAQRRAENAVISGVQERAAGGHHLLAVTGGFGAHALHRQKMPVALLGAVKAVAFFTFQGAVPGQLSPAQGALPQGKRFMFHTSSL